MRTLPWFRLYFEARNDAKLRTLNDAQFRVWFNLLCFAAEQESSRGVIENYPRDLLAIEVSSGDVEMLTQTLDRLKALRIIVCDGDTITFVNFEKRQYDKPSDHPEQVTERVRRFRAKQNVTPPDGPVTPSHAVKRDVTPRNAVEGEGEGESSNGKESKSVDEEGATAPVVTDASRVLFKQITKAAKLAATEESLQRLVERHKKLSAQDIVLEAECAADWIADPTRNKKKQQMSLRFLNNWLTKAEQPPPVYVNGNAALKATGTNGHERPPAPVQTVEDHNPWTGRLVRH